MNNQVSGRPLVCAALSDMAMAVCGIRHRGSMFSYAMFMGGGTLASMGVQSACQKQSGNADPDDLSGKAHQERFLLCKQSHQWIPLARCRTLM